MTIDDRLDAHASITRASYIERHRQLLAQNGRRWLMPASPPPPSTVYPDG